MTTASFLTAALMASLVMPATAGTITLGDPTIDRAIDDSAVGSMFIQPEPLFPGQMSNWSFFDNDTPGRQVTPVIFQRTGPGAFRIAGIGTTQTSSGGGTQSFSFGLTSGSDATGPDYYFGWKDGSNGTNNEGTIDFNASQHAVRWLGGGHTSFSVGSPKTVTLDIAYGFPGRAYSLQFTQTVTGSATGDQAVARELTDGAVGSIFAGNDPLPIGFEVTHWGFFDMNGADLGQSVTPLLIENVAGSYVIRGIGTPRSSHAEGGQVFDFGLVSGTATPANGNYFIGWKDGTNGTNNDGVIDYDNNGADSVAYFNTHTSFSDGENLGAGLALPRSYSIRYLSIPEPGILALFLLAAPGLCRRRR